MFIIKKLYCNNVPKSQPPKKSTKSLLYNSIIVITLILSSNAQVSLCSRRFLTGLIIGTLLARNGMQGPSYSGPPQAAYPTGSGHHHHQQQQPLFIIIPSAPNSHRKARSYHNQYPHIMKASPTMEPYGAEHYPEHQFLHRRTVLKKIKQPMRKPRKYIKGFLDKINGPYVTENPLMRTSLIVGDKLDQNSAPTARPLGVGSGDSRDILAGNIQMLQLPSGTAADLDVTTV